MAKLDRYIGVHVFLAILSVLGVIVGLALLFAFIDELGDVEVDLTGEGVSDKAGGELEERGGGAPGALPPECSRGHALRERRSALGTS